MKKSFVLLLILICSGCAKDPVKPPADLRYLSVDRNDLSIYDISYDSDIDLLDLFDRGEGVGYAAAMLVCALGDDQEFSIKHNIRLAAYGSIRGGGHTKTDGTFRYVTSTLLSEYSSDGGLRRDLTSNELKVILGDKASIPCKVLITAYGYKPYYSNTLYIPTTDLLREINKPKSN
ncbi:hypothetical protein [Pseudomonas frederiksbergensis]|uniref:Uncharacterized protein n=1 Tax=Pseudomonas frederiksbergensis TaxID=104087 RepID=A0A423KQI3_9PSED|nr:hypothetical protein [Pseudomonas frederiksbergensis]RON57439.1 hypothetical protein BK665_04870 [Pseudomonas frederiksbergensis]